MSNTLYFSREQLLTPPTKRAAYSDRMAYVSAELSRLAYFPFEGGARLEKVIEVVSGTSIDEGAKSELIDRIIELIAQDRFDGKGGVYFVACRSCFGYSILLFCNSPRYYSIRLLT